MTRLAAFVADRRASLGLDDEVWAKLMKVRPAGPQGLADLEAAIAGGSLGLDLVLALAKALDADPATLLDRVDVPVEVRCWSSAWVGLMELERIARAYGLARTFALFDRLPALEAELRAVLPDRRAYLAYDLEREGPLAGRSRRGRLWWQRLDALVAWGEALLAHRDGGWDPEAEARLAAQAEAIERDHTYTEAVAHDALAAFLRPTWDARLAESTLWYPEWVSRGADVEVELADELEADGLEAGTTLFLMKLGDGWPFVEDLLLVRHRGELRVVVYAEDGDRGRWVPFQEDDPRGGFPHGPDVEPLAWVMSDLSAWNPSYLRESRRFNNGAARRAWALGGAEG